MGFKLKCILVEAPLLPLCELLGLEDRGLRAGGFDLRGTMLRSGFCLVEEPGIYPLFLSSDLLQRASHVYPIICVQINEGVNCSSAEKWDKGQQVWSVAHDACSNGPRHLEYSGSLPEIFEEVKRNLFAEQDLEDRLEEDGIDAIFDIPVELTERLTGYRYSNYIPEEQSHCLFRRDRPRR
ncbi:hypothetical protein KF728_05865 [Candidatus Obscuribacterales bacterium]|nr:hypothetical protein [Candidatus Obscuribacterales bacterium]